MVLCCIASVSLAASACGESQQPPQPVLSAPALVTEAPAALPTQSPPRVDLPPSQPAPTIILYVANTDGIGVFLRRTPDPTDRVKAWGDGTPMTLVGADVNNTFGAWRNVRDPDGNVGYIASQFLATTRTARPSATIMPPVPPTAPPVVVTATTAPAIQPATPEASIAEAANLVTKSLVVIRTSVGWGSGFKVPDGILTNAHVVEGVTSAEVGATGIRSGMAKVNRIDRSNDLALLTDPIGLSPAQLIGAQQVPVGETLLILGFPRPDAIGIDRPTLTKGVLSRVRVQGTTILVHTDAAVNAGNSGGPIFTVSGQVVAIVRSSVRDAEGLNVGIATESIRAFLDGRPSAIDPPARPPTPTVKPATMDPNAADVWAETYFGAISRGDIHGAWDCCVSDAFRRRVGLEQFEGSFTGTSSFRFARPARQASTAVDRIEADIDYSFQQRSGTRLYYTLHVLLIREGGRWVADQTTAKPQ